MKFKLNDLWVMKFKLSFQTYNMFVVLIEGPVAHARQSSSIGLEKKVSWSALVVEMLVHFSIHVCMRVCVGVCVQVRVHFGVTLWGVTKGWSTTPYEPLDGEVRASTALGAGLLVRDVVVSVGYRPGWEGTLPQPAVAQPQHNGAHHEKSSCWDTNDQGPRETRAQMGRGHRFLHLRIYANTSIYISFQKSFQESCNTSPNILHT